MSTRRIGIGDWIDLDGEPHQIVALLGSNARLRSYSGAHQIALLAELLTHAQPAPAPAAGERSDPSAQARLHLDRTALLDSLGEAGRARVLDLEGHLLELTTGYRSGTAERALPGEPRPDYTGEVPLMARVAAKAGELGISERWLRQLRDDWRERGLWALVDKRSTKPADPLAGIDPRLLAAIREQHRAEHEDSSGTVSGRFRRRVQNRLDLIHGPGVVTLPPDRSFRRLVSQVLPLSPSAAAARRASQAARRTEAFGHAYAQRPGEIVMMDTTPLDVLAYDPVHDTNVRVELTLAICVASRCVLAWRFTPLGTKGIDIGLLLADVLTPEPMRPAWQDALRFSILRVPYQRLLDIDARLAQAAARPVVYPETLVIDHGKPYQSQVTERACRLLGISIQDARQMRPTDKAIVERVFGTIRTQFSEHVAGYKGPNLAHRGRTADAQARWSIPELEELFAEYVLAVYHRRHHAGLMLPGFPEQTCSPNEAYALALTYTGYLDTPSDPNLYYQLLPIAWRSIQPAGVEIDHLIYDSPILNRYRGARSPYPDGKWPIRHDPRNRLHGYFHNPADDSWHVLRWAHALDEHLPFTDNMLAEVKRLLKTRGRRSDDQAEVAAALLDLQNRTDAPETWTPANARQRARDAERARVAARDQHRAAAAIDHEYEPPTLQVLPGGAGEGTGDDPLNLDELATLEVWTPGGWRQDP